MALAGRPLATDSATATLSIWINRALEILWLLAVVLVPLAFLDRDIVVSEAVIAYVEVPKIALLRTLAGLMAVLWVVEWGLGKLSSPPRESASASSSLLRLLQVWLAARPARLVAWLREQPTRWLVLAVWAFVATTVLSTVFSGSFSASLWGEVPGQDGFATYTMLCYVLLFAVITTHLKSRAQLWRLLGAIVLMGVLVALVGVAQHFGTDPFQLQEPLGGRRVTATMGNAIFAASLLLMTVGVSLLAATVTLVEPPPGRPAVKQIWPWATCLGILGFWVAVLAVQLMGLTFTFSRGPWVGTLLTLALFPVLALVFCGWRALGRTVLVLSLASAVTLVALNWGGLFTTPSGGFWTAVLALVLLYGIACLAIGRWNSPRWSPSLGRAIPSSGLALGLALALGAVVILASSNVRDLIEPPEGSASETPAVTRRFASIKQEVATGLISRRGEIWERSWKLIKERPWFAFDEASWPWLRPLIGYGPDMFRYTYLLVSIPGPSGNQVPMEPDHAHNYFINQAVEQGYLGLASSLAIFGSILLVGGYLLRQGRKEYSYAHKMVLVALLAIMAGRTVEQMVGLARVSDLTIFWALLAVFATLPVVFKQPGPTAEVSHSPPAGRRARDRSRRSSYRSRSLSWQSVAPLVLAAVLIGGVFALTWTKAISYPRAAAAAASGVQEFERGDLQSTLERFRRATEIAPDVFVYYSHLASTYEAYVEFQDQVVPEEECSISRPSQPYEGCLYLNAYLNNRKAAEQRPFYFRTRMSLAESTLNLSLVTRDEDKERITEEALRYYRQVTALVPQSWPLKNQLAAAYLDAGKPEKALPVLEESLAITEGTNLSANAIFLRGVAYRELGDLEKAAELLDRSMAMDSSPSSKERTRETLEEVQRRLEDQGQQ